MALHGRKRYLYFMIISFETLFLLWNIIKQTKWGDTFVPMNFLLLNFALWSLYNSIIYANFPMILSILLLTMFLGSNQIVQVLVPSGILTTCIASSILPWSSATKSLNLTESSKFACSPQQSYETHDLPLLVPFNPAILPSLVIFSLSKTFQFDWPGIMYIVEGQVYRGEARVWVLQWSDPTKFWVCLIALHIFLCPFVVLLNTMNDHGKWSYCTKEEAIHRSYWYQWCS